MPSPEMPLKPGILLHPAVLLRVQAAIDPYAPTTVASEEREEVLHIITFRGGKLAPLLRQAQPVRVWAWGGVVGGLEVGNADILLAVSVRRIHTEIDTAAGQNEYNKPRISALIAKLGLPSAIDALIGRHVGGSCEDIAHAVSIDRLCVVLLGSLDSGDHSINVGSGAGGRGRHLGSVGGVASPW